MKTCSKCKIEKEESEFYKNQRLCKICKKENDRIYYQNNKEKIIDKNKEYYQNNKEKVKKVVSAYRKDNKEYYAKLHKKYRENNKEFYKEYFKEYFQNNKEHKNKWHKEYDKNRKKIDPNYKLRCNISIAITGALKRNNSSKQGLSCLKHLPYTIEELKKHLESQFEDWMNWNNWSIYNCNTYDENPTWQIDHIIPQSHFNYTSMEDEEFKKCWSLENLRPLSSKQNVEDGNRRL